MINDNPVWEAEQYQIDLEDKQNSRDFIICDQCGSKIYKSDAFYDGDTMYDFDGYIVCEDCLQDYLSKYRKECR